MSKNSRTGYEVVIRDGRKIVTRQTFKNEADAWAFLERYENYYSVEFVDLSYRAPKAA